MKVVTAKQMRQIDKEATGRFAIPALILMENAARSCIRPALEMLRGRKTVIVFCGQGNNGGDGFSLARHLINRGIGVKVFFLGRLNKLSNEARINYQILRKLGIKFKAPKLALLKQELKQADLIIDALLGIGLKSKVREPLYSLIELINSSRRPVLSLDIPSGLDATSGEICGIAVRARRTVTFGLFKNGFLNPQAKKLVGKLSVGDISLPRQLIF